MKKHGVLRLTLILLITAAAFTLMLVSCKKKNNNNTPTPETENKVSVFTDINYADEAAYTNGRLDENQIKYMPVDMELGKTYYAIIDVSLTAYSLDGSVRDATVDIDISPSSVIHATVEETGMTLVKERLILDSTSLVLSTAFPEGSNTKKYRCIVALTPLEVGEVTVSVNLSAANVTLSGTLSASETLKNVGSEIAPSPLEYQLSGDGTYYSVVGLGQLQGNVATVPATYQSLPVKEIGERAFYGYSALKKVTLPEGLERIGASAFEGCSRLFHINLPTTLTDVHSTAFNGTDLRSANAPVKCIGFLPMDKLTVLTVNGAGNITAETLSGFARLRSLTALDGDLTADENALEGLNVTVANVHPNFVDHLPKTSVAYVNIKAGTEIPENVGVGFTSLLQLTVYDGITSIGNNAFTECKKLKKIINNSSVVLSSDVYGYDPLHLSRVLLVRKGEFVYYCVNSDDGTRSEYLLAYVGESGDVVLPGDVEQVQEYAFSGNRVIKNVLIPGNIKDISNYAFSGSSVESVRFAADSEISDLRAAFYDCPSLKSFEFPKNVTDVSGALYGSKNVETVTVNPENATLYAEGNCVIDKATGTVVLGCKGSIIPTSPEVTGIATDAFENLDITEVFIPANIVTLSKRPFNQCPYIEKIEVDVGNPVYESVSDCLIKKEGKILILGCKNSVIPDDYGITEISSYAFSGCGIKSVSVPEGVTSIGEHVFNGCKQLENVTLPGTLKSIGRSAFANLSVLTEIRIPKTVNYIGENAFNGSGELALYLQKGIKTNGFEEYWNRKGSSYSAGSLVILYHSPKSYE